MIINFEELVRAISSIEANVSILKNDLNEIKESVSESTVPVDRYLNKIECSKIANVSVSTIDNWRRAGRIKPFYFDSVVRFRYDEFMEFLSKQKKQ